MPRKSKPGVLNSTIAASKDILNKIRKIEKRTKEYNPVLAWTLTPIIELAKFGPEVWVDIDDAFRKEKKRKTTIAPPGWDDVIKTGFDAPVSSAELSAYKRYKKSGGKNPLSPEQEETLQKKKDRAIRISQSPTPSSVRSIGTILTWLDDIQDSMVTLAFAAKLAAKITGRFSSQLAKKWALPLAYIESAAEMLTLSGILKLGGKTADINRVKDLIARGALKGGDIALRTSRKRQVYAALEAMPNLTSRQFKYLNKLRGFLPSFAEAVQIAQTTAQTTGYGLSLGGIIGYASDEVFGTLRGSKRQPLTGLGTLKQRLQEAQTHYPTETAPTPAVRSLRVEESIKEYQRLYKSPELTPLTLSALNILNIGPQLMAVAGDLSVDDNIFILTAVKRATAYISNIGALDGWEVWSKPHLDLQVLPPPVSFDNQFLINEISPDLIQEEYFLPYFDGVKIITPRLQTSLLAPKISNGFSKWLKPLGADLRVNYAMGIIADLAGDSFGMYEGAAEEMITRLTPAGRATMALHDYGLESALGTPRDIENAFYSQLMDHIIRTGGTNPTFQQVSAWIDLLRRLF